VFEEATNPLLLFFFLFGLFVVYELCFVAFHILMTFSRLGFADGTLLSLFFMLCDGDASLLQGRWNG
jgi:hypothetical protein